MIGEQLPFVSRQKWRRGVVRCAAEFHRLVLGIGGGLSRAGLTVFLLVAAGSTAPPPLFADTELVEEDQGESGDLGQETLGTKLPELTDNRTSGPYCGIYSLYVCLSSLGIETRPEDYVSTRYVGSFRGSSAKDLIDAAENFGAQAQCFSHLTDRELQRVNVPMLLHMRASWSDADFNHWVAFLGYDADRVRIIDAPHPLQTISPAELLANWDGAAIAISRDMVDQSFLVDSWIDRILLAGGLLLALYVLGASFGNGSPLLSDAPLQTRAKTLALQVGMIAGISLLLALGYHALSNVGFLANPSALAEVTRRHYSVDIPEISLSETENEIRSIQPLLLDARHVQDYQHGALSGAKSMPVDSTLPERQKVLAGVPMDKRIIVYCQSASCGYADEIARFLKFNGYRNLAIYRDGYRVWSQSHEVSDDATPEKTGKAG